MRARSKFGYLLIITAMSSLISSCGESRNAARVGNRIITIDRVAEEVGRTIRANPPFSYGALLAKTNELVDNELAAIDAHRLALDKKPDLIEQVDRFRDGQVYVQVINKKVIEKVIPDKLVKEKYLQNSREYHVRHLFFAKKKGEIVPEVREQANRLRSQLLRGEDFESLARQFSQDSLSAGKGGDLGFVRWGNGGWGEPFYRAIAKLKRGQISRVVESNKGLHIIRLEEIRRVNQPPFSKAKEELRRTFYRAKGQELDSAYNDFVRKIEKRYRAQYPENTADSLLKIMVAAPKEMGIDVQRDPLRLLDSLSAAQRSLPLAKYAGGQFTIEDAVRNYERISPRRRPLLDNPKEIQTFLSRNVPRRLIIDYGMRRGYHRKAAVRQAVSSERKRLLAERARKLKVLDRMEVSKDDVENFYRENPYLFTSGALMNVQQIVVKNEALAFDLYDRAVAGEDFTELFKAYDDRESKEDEGRLGWISDQTKGGIAVNAAKLNVGEISKPFKVSEGFAIIKVLERQGGEPVDWSKSENRAKRELRIRRREQLEKAWLDSVRVGVPVVINKAVIRKEAGLANN